MARSNVDRKGKEGLAGAVVVVIVVVVVAVVEDCARREWSVSRPSTGTWDIIRRLGEE